MCRASAVAGKGSKTHLLDPPPRSRPSPSRLGNAPEGPPCKGSGAEATGFDVGRGSGGPSVRTPAAAAGARASSGAGRAAAAAGGVLLAAAVAALLALAA
jgi:hypothetical protein